jgi:3-dehydroquinate synthase
MADLRISKLFEVRSKIKDSYQVFQAEDLKVLIDWLSTESANIFVIDRKVADYFSTALAGLENARFIHIDADEFNKTMDYAQEIIRKLIRLDVRKNDNIVAIGGGITQDLVAYISSILFRGIEWKFIPTTLLSQCDSCIGSKSSINFDQYKNLIGTFNPPSAIYINSDFLSTLSESEIRSGIGEMLHYFFSDGFELADEVGQRFDELLVNRGALSYFISNSLRIKKTIIEIDEFDIDLRHIFNYGHTFGHAIEAITNYSIPHGQAISIGMDLANYISLKKGLLSQEDFNRMHTVLIKNLPAFRVTKENYDSYVGALSRDKKNHGNKLGCILSRGPGKLEKVFTEMDEAFKEIVLDYFTRFQN